MCVVAGFSAQPAAEASEAITMLASKPLPAGETSQVRSGRVRKKKKEGKILEEMEEG